MQVMQARFDAALAALLLPEAGAQVLAVALSGGADSMALALLAQHHVQAQGGALVTLTVDHGLRPESRAEAQQVAAWMRARGIAHHILTPEHRPVARNLQAAARAWRYNALAEFCQQHGIVHCLVAHQAGDNRETLLHSQTRGNTADGNAGMARVRHHGGVRFLRPLLVFERAELEAFLHAQQSTWIDDPSNRDRRFARVRHRAQLQGDGAQQAALDAMLRHEAAARTARDHALAEAAIRCVTFHPLGFLEVDLRVLREHEDKLASQLIADGLTTIGGHASRPRARDTQRLMEALAQPFRTRTLHGCELSCRGERLRIAREFARAAAPLELAGAGHAVWDTRFRILYDIPPGQCYTLRALGRDGTRQLRAQLPGVPVLPLASPSLWHLDELAFVPYITPAPGGVAMTVGFAPVKPLAAAPFW